MDTYNSGRDFTDAFRERVADWLQATGEVFVVLRYLRAGGQKDFLFCRSESEFSELLDSVPEGTDTIVFQQPQLTLRGVCTGSFIEQTLASIADGTEYLVCRLRHPQNLQFHISGHMGDTHTSLRDDMLEFLGEEVAVGHCPDFIAADGPSMISASKGGLDGPR
jgi:hypothetical protein